MPHPDAIARTILETHDARRGIPPLTESLPAFDLAAAYRVTAQVRHLREARGERVVGRKIGFTNRTIWDQYGVHAPIWGYVYDTTLHRLDAPLPLDAYVEPRIEPEIVFRLARAPEPGMSDPALLACIATVSHGFEIVQSLFPGWRFAAPDTVAAFGLHGALLMGPEVEIASRPGEAWLGGLAGFTIELRRNGAPADRGTSANVLDGGPLAALRHLVDLLAADPGSPPLRPGEVVSTGTLTRALPVTPGETWSTAIDGVPLPGVTLTLA
ncbi:2-keto-4-pentenoate hydratase [Salinarimonas soli]|uniref:Hydratase n=1 Tax=Salinarimonas soli TaxID=1638099 RepID=A0A5B2VW71_9HYPH|nr:hydratase [Salinarimonas soli]KAA2242299.1 hydratase [Salinarimonas soli]